MDVEEKDANEDFDNEKWVQIRVLSDGLDEETQDTLILHVHGGGFVAQSSASQQTITRKWAKMMPNAVICSIDYRLSPKSRFP